MSAILSHHPNRIRWACRRGMLELDLFLLPFFDSVFESLSLAEQHEFIAFLEQSDPDLFQWLMQKEPAPLAYQGIVRRIIDFKQGAFS